MPHEQAAESQAHPVQPVVVPSYPPTLVAPVGRPVTWCYQVDRVEGSEKLTNSITIFVRPHKPIMDESGESGYEERFQTVTLTRAEVAQFLRMLNDDIDELKRAIPERAHEFE